MKLLYSCHQCLIVKAEIDAPDRHPSEDIKSWMDVVIRIIAVDHSQRSPFCRATEISEIHIPMPPGTERIGEPVKQ